MSRNKNSKHRRQALRICLVRHPLLRVIKLNPKPTQRCLNRTIAPQLELQEPIFSPIIITTTIRLSLFRQQRRKLASTTTTKHLMIKNNQPKGKPIYLSTRQPLKLQLKLLEIYSKTTRTPSNQPLRLPLCYSTTMLII